jgi:hypothetical protein
VSSLLQTISKVPNVLAQAVIPVYCDYRSKPALLGSGFFLNVQGVHFFISVGHVLDEIKRRDLYFYSSPRIKRSLCGNLRLSKDDSLDVGVLKLSGEPTPPYYDVDKFAVNLSWLRPGLIPRNGKRFLIVGFPASQNKVNPQSVELRATL